jgi:DNA integrity scanning protein DisA with diadenylate cyclase activity
MGAVPEQDGDHNMSLGKQSEGVPASVAAAAFRMKELGAGGIIVLRGRKQLEAHIPSGFKRTDQPATAVALLAGLEQGEALLAVVVEHGRLTMTDVALPLDPELQPGPSFGSRHTCARTLSTRTDALAIVTSEERRNVVTFLDGEQIEMQTQLDLEESVRRFLAERG